ncbi:EamA family transporter, partial [candidate division KSB3 bacterium]|nr:EamA family transporter [candidate division KSB3 bacterium]MBD3327171.1 EamA family transporter [candidate division KSB3 bacterium]
MNTQTLKSNLLLLLTAIIWGFAFVAQRVGMDYVGPFTFNGIRFALGALSLLPLLYVNQRHMRAEITPLKTVLVGGALAGSALFIAVSLQQIGLVYTTAGKAGFITGLYVVIVPLLGLFWRQNTTFGTWLGAVLAAIGLYLLSVTGTFTIAFGDLLVVISAFFWAIHVQLIGWLTRRMDSLKLAFWQFLVCSVLSLITAIFTETITLQSIRDALIPIAYGGLFSVGVAYTLQVVAQRHAHAAHAAIILSLESVFAAVGGWLLLGETLSPRGLIGCALMLSGMLLSQFNVESTHLKACADFLISQRHPRRHSR